MVSSSSNSTASFAKYPDRLCECKIDFCRIMVVNKSEANRGRHYYVCLSEVSCRLWIGWCDEYANAFDTMKFDGHLAAPTIDELQGQIRDEVMQTRAEIMKIRAMMKEVVASQTMVKYAMFLVMCLCLILLAKGYGFRSSVRPVVG